MKAARSSDRYLIVEFSALVEKKGFVAALEEYSKITGKDKDEIKRIYRSCVDQIEGY